MDKIVFASEQLPSELDNRARFALWREIYEATYVSLDLAAMPDRPFNAQFEFSQFGSIGLGHFNATLGSMARSAPQIAKSPRDHLCLILAGPDCSIVHKQLGREVMCRPGSMVLTFEGEAGSLDTPTGLNWHLLDIPRSALSNHVDNVVDRVATSIRPDAEIAAHLRRYATMLLGSGPSPSRPALAAHIGDTLLDLATLALGSVGESSEIARANGLRMARREAAIAEINAGFRRPEFSPQHVATKLGLSPRYVQELLQESGASFTERVLELRLQKARAALADANHATRSVVDIALDCGFSDISYFNRCFRRRFADTPTGVRGLTRRDH